MNWKGTTCLYSPITQLLSNPNSHLRYRTDLDQSLHVTPTVGLPPTNESPKLNLSECMGFTKVGEIHKYVMLHVLKGDNMTPSQEVVNQELKKGERGEGTLRLRLANKGVKSSGSRNSHRVNAVYIPHRHRPRRGSIEILAHEAVWYSRPRFY
jgi:hypothetical protein